MRTNLILPFFWEKHWRRRKGAAQQRGDSISPLVENNNSFPELERERRKERWNRHRFCYLGKQKQQVLFLWFEVMKYCCRAVAEGGKAIKKPPLLPNGFSVEGKGGKGFF